MVAWLTLVAAAGSPVAAEEAGEARAASLVAAVPLAPEAYEAVRAQIEAQRRQLAARYSAAQPESAAALAEAERAFAHALVEEILPRWIGVQWRRGEASLARRPEHDAGIHCASFVIAALEGTGLRFAHRDQLAQAPALRILEALATEAPTDAASSALEAGGIARWRGTVPALRRELLRRGPGVYLLGLTRHIGFAIVGAPAGLARAAAPPSLPAPAVDAAADPEVWLVHASRGSGAVVVEKMASSRAMQRRHGTAIFVAALVGGREPAGDAATGQASGDPSLMQRWLAATPLGPR